MRKCKFCQAELEENSQICPSCGADNTPVSEDAAPQPVTPDQEPAQPASDAAPDLTAPEPAADAPAETQDACEAPAAEQAGEQAPTAPIKEGIQSPGKVALTIAAVVVLLAVLIALVMAGTKNNAADTDASQPSTTVEETVPATIPADGNPDDATCKGSYTVSDDEVLAQRDTVVATIGDNTLTNSQLQVYYWMEVQGFLTNYGSYAPYFGLNPSQSLDTQLCPQAEGLTWQQYFLQSALNNWQQMQSMSIQAQKDGLSMDAQSQEYLQTLDSTLESIAKSYSIDVDELMLKNFGAGADVEDYRHFQQLYHTGYPYFNDQVSKMEPTDKDLEEFFALHQEEYANSGLTKEDTFVDVRHILLKVEGGTTDESGNTTYSDEEWAACEKKAQEVLDTWLAGDKTEQSFGQLAEQRTEDPGSQTTGGLYERVPEGQMVQAFNDWCFDESRQSGDYGLVKTEYGYHVMYFVRSYPQWTYFAQRDWVNEKTGLMIEDLIAAYPMEVSYEKISLGNVTMG